MSDTPPAQPPVKGGPAPYLATDGNGAEVVEFYKRAFAAEEVSRMQADDGKRLMHCHVYINGGSLMLSDAFPEYGHPFRQPQGVTIHLEVDDADAWYDRAVAAGCTATMPLDNMFWGQRFGQLKDPFGFSWSIGGPVKG